MIEFSKIALKSMWESKLRTFLTLLGIIIGISSVITVFSVGYGAKADIGKTISSFGSNLMWMYPTKLKDRSGKTKKTSLKLLKIKDMEYLKEFKGVDLVAPVISDNEKIEFGDIKEDCKIIGTTPELLKIRNEKIDKGIFLTKKNIEKLDYVCVISKDMKDTYFSEKDPIGTILKFAGSKFRIIGFLRSKEGGKLIGSRQNLEVFVPITILQVLKGYKFVSYFLFTKKDEFPFQDVINRISNIFTARSSFSTKYKVFSLEKEKAKIDKVLNTLTFVFVILAGISLLVGGIGVMNIMLFTVTERTREIGIRKAVGASRTDILIQFLFESIIISLVGGVIGIFLGIIFSNLIAIFAKWPAIVPISAIIIAVSTSILTGVIFGIYPANKASKMDAIEALRYE